MRVLLLITNLENHNFRLTITFIQEPLMKIVNLMRAEKQILSYTVTLLIVLFFVSAGFSTNGYFSHGYGTHYKGLAGAGTALSLSAFAPAINPAGLTGLGKRVDVGVAYFNPSREFSVTGNPSGFPNTFGLAPGMVESGSNSFIIPSVAGHLSLPGGHHLGLAIYGNGGMNTDYQAPVFGNNPTGVDLSQLFAAGTYAREIVPGHSIGISGIFAWQRFKAEGLQAFGNFSSDANKLTNNDYSTSTGFGARIGYLGKILPMLSVGASYQTKMSMSEFEDYSGLFAEKGDFDIPASWNVGVAVQALKVLKISADVQQILYSGIKSINNPLLPNLQQARLGDDDGAGFGWENMTVYKVGAQATPLPTLTLRAGYSYGEQPIPQSEVLFNILAPGVVEQHVTFGLSKTLIPLLDVHFALMYAFSNSVQGPNALEAPGQQQIELTMKQVEAEVGVSFSF
jgi:long-chain fatty acid transport protein